MSSGGDDNLDRSFMELHKQQVEDDKARWITEAVILGRLSILAAITSDGKIGVPTISTITRLKHTVLREKASGVIDTDDWPQELTLGIDTEEN